MKRICSVGFFLWAAVISSLFAQTEARLGPPPRLDIHGIPNQWELKSPVFTIGVDAWNRNAVVDYFNNEYRTSEGVDAGWTGDMGACLEGSTTVQFRQAVLRRVNYFRGMAGLPADIAFDDARHPKCQKAALIMIAEGNLSHTPDDGWACYTVDGAQAASKSNLALGRYGPESIDLYMKDSGQYNTALGHRRWVLFPPQKTMATGDSSAKNGFFYGANALWVIGDFGTRPPTPDGVSWPPPGFVPFQVVFPRWSFSFPDADFSKAVVEMRKGGLDVPVTTHGLKSGYGDNTIVWEPEGLPSAVPENDVHYTVRISGVRIGEANRNFEYSVSIIDPDKTPELPVGFFLY